MKVRFTGGTITRKNGQTFAVCPTCGTEARVAWEGDGYYFTMGGFCA